MGIDEAAAIKAVRQAAEKLLSADERNLCRLDSDDDCALIYPILQSKKELLEMLVEGTSQKFIDCLVGHLDFVTRFTPVLNKVFEKK